MAQPAGGDIISTWASSLLGSVYKGADNDTVTDNPQSLSLFPQFGDNKNRPMFVEFEYGGDEDTPIVQVQENVGTRDESDEEEEEEEDGGFWPDSGDKNKFWMPDRLCKVCYDCEQPFNMLRRRHHCRLCGQVFCHSCSPYFIDGKSLNVAGSIRACKMCNDQVESSHHQQPLPRKQQPGDRLKDEDGGFGPSNQLTNGGTGDRGVGSGGTKVISEGMGQSVSGGNGGMKEGEEQRPRRVTIVSDGSAPKQAVGLGLSVQEPGSSATLEHKSLVSLNDMNLTVDFDNDDDKERLDANNIANKFNGHAVQSQADVSGDMSNSGGGSTLTSGGDPSRAGKMDSVSVAAAKAALPSRRGSNPILWAQQRMKGIGNKAGLHPVSAVIPLGTPFVASAHFAGPREGFDFKTGDKGTGYYPSPTPMTANTDTQKGTTHNLNENQEPSSRNFESKADLKKHRDALRTGANKHLNDLVEEFVASAPLLSRSPEVASKWKEIVVNLSKQVVASVDPDVRRQGDHLDVTNYVKIKTIAGGEMNECCYVDGIVFRKQVLHKQMQKSINSPKILLLAGGIEFQRGATQRMATFDTLLEQERTYMTILVEKIVSLKPDLVLVGQAVSRAAQEYLEQHDVVVVQHVKVKLMKRIARSIGAIILSGTDHVMNRTNVSDTPLGLCSSFSVVAFPSPVLEAKLKRREKRRLANEDSASSSASSSDGDDGDDGAPHLRRTRGHGYVNHIYLEGCPKDLGCTLVLRGADKATLKEVKRIMRGAINAAYNLRLEQAYLNNRCVRLPDSIFDPIALGYSSRLALAVNSGGSEGAEVAEAIARKRRLLSTSLAVDFGPVRMPEVRFDSVSLMKKKSVDPLRTTAAEHQSILVTSVWMSSRVQCAPAEVKRILYYTHQDLGLGQFLLESCFNSAHGYPPMVRFHGERRSVLDITQMFSHHQGRLSISVKKMDNGGSEGGDKPREGTRMRMWSYCKKCQRVVTPVQPMSEDTWKLSFGKFLEIMFYNRAALGRTGGCDHSIQTDHVLFFGCGSLAARFEYETVKPYDIFSRRLLPLDERHRKKHLAKSLEHTKSISSELFQLFADKTHELEERSKEAGGRPEFLQLCLSELGQIQSEVHHSRVQLDRKLAEETKLKAVSQDGDNQVNAYEKHEEEGSSLTDRVNFPFQFRRDLFLRASHWNERLSVVGQLVESLQQQQKGGGSSSRLEDDLVSDGQKRLAALKHSHGRQLTVATTGQSANEYGDGDDLEEDDGVFLDVMDPQANSDSDDDLDMSTRMGSSLIDQNEDEEVMKNKPGEVDTVSKDKKGNRGIFGIGQRLVSGKNSKKPTLIPTAIDEGEDEGDDEDISGLRGAVLDASEVLDDLERDDQLKEGPHSLAATYSVEKDWRTRSLDTGSMSPRKFSSQHSTPLPELISDLDTHTSIDSPRPHNSSISSTSNNRRMSSRSVAMPLVGTNTASKISSTFAKLLGKDTPEEDHWKVGLGEFAEGRPGLEPGSNGVVLVFEDQPTSIIAYSLSSPYYREMLEEFLCMDVDSGRTHGDSFLTDNPMFHQPEEPVSTSSALERQMLSTHKSHIKHRFQDVDEKGNTLCKFMCQSYWATQFHAVRKAFLQEDDDEGFISSLGLARQWDAQGGKSGATFLKSMCGRFVVKQITRTELQMFLDYAPAYFEYMAKNFFHGMETVLCKVVGVYTIGFQNRVSGKRYMEQVVVMQNLFHERVTTRIFDLKGSTRSRYVRVEEKEEEHRKKGAGDSSDQMAEGAEEVEKESSSQVLLDDNFLEYTQGRPLPLHDRAKEYFNRAVLNDTLFLSIINVVDYSILVGMDENKKELVVGIIDYMRQYDIIKKMERMGKSVGMIAGQAEPTIIQPPAYRNRFQAAMQRYFMMVPDKWTPFHMLAVPVNRSPSSSASLQVANTPSASNRPTVTSLSSTGDANGGEPSEGANSEAEEEEKTLGTI